MSKKKTKHYEHSIVDINSLTYNESNPRTHGDKQIDQIARSIKQYGFTNPVLVDEDNVLVAGHGRYLAAQKMGITEIPVITITGLTAAQKAAYLIADNQIGLNSAWDIDGLKNIVDDIRGMDLEIGFTDTEMDRLFRFEDETKDDIELDEMSFKDDQEPMTTIKVMVPTSQTKAAKAIIKEALAFNIPDGVIV